uniref:Doublecortin domain-containing protein n=1 Tax=Angiostrongylus cantonensis TaxID=6313 RepID=A0A158P6F8_ANGCA
MTMPKIPVTPRNGMIRVYDNQERTFTDPYSTKTVFFYKEGDEYFTVSSGVRVPISKSRYRTFDRLLDDLNENIHMPFGVRRLTTPMGRTSIHDIAELQHLGK